MEYIYYYLMTNNSAINTGLLTFGSMLTMASLSAISNDIKAKETQRFAVKMLLLGVFVLFLFVIFPTKEYFQYLINKG